MKKIKLRKCLPCEGTGIQPKEKWKQVDKPVYCKWCKGDGISITQNRYKR